MDLTKKFSELTQNQKKQFNEVKDAVQLNAFLSENNIEVSEEQKKTILEYLETGKIPLSDEELDNVAGGGCGGDDGFRYVITGKDVLKEPALAKHVLHDL